MKRLWTCILLTSLIVGCASTHKADVSDDPASYQQKGRIQWNSSNLKSVLDIENAQTDRDLNGLLRVRLVLRNRTKQDIFVDIRTTYTDQQGFEKERTNWEPVCCTARTQTTYDVVSLSPNVHDFQIIIRDPKSAEQD